MVQNDNEFFRGPPEGSPTLATDQRPTGAEVFQVMPEISTPAVDVPTTAQEEVPKDPPRKKSKARRITKAIKLLASCMAAVVITEAAANIAATIEPPAEVPTGQYYAGQWPGADPVSDGVYSMDLEADMGYSIQIPMNGNVWRLTAGTDWRMCWFEGNGYSAYIDLENQQTGVYLVAELSLMPHTTNHEEDSYTTLTTPTGEMLYIRAFFLSLGQYGEEYGLSEEMMAASAELRQALVDDIFAGIEVTPGTADGWQGFEIGDKLYSQQSEEWYGVGGFGDLEIHIPWVHYAADYGLQDKTPYARETVNGITWSIYFTENDTYLWAVPNIDPEICLGGYTARFMCADAVRRGEYINDDEWLEMGGFTSASQRQTAVDILIECLQHHYALSSVPVEEPQTEPVEEPLTEPVEEADPVWYTQSMSNNVQISLGHRGYKLASNIESAWMTWYFTRNHNGVMAAELSLGADFGATVYISDMPMEMYDDRNHGQIPVDTGETLYWYCVELYDGDDTQIADFMRGVTASEATDDGWGRILIEDSICSRQGLYWSGWETVNPDGGRTVMMWNLERTANMELGVPVAQREINGILWTLYVIEDYSSWNWPFIWAVPDIDPEIAIGSDYENAVYKYYEDNDMMGNFYGNIWSTDSLNGAAEMIFEVLHNYYPQ